MYVHVHVTVYRGSWAFINSESEVQEASNVRTCCHLRAGIKIVSVSNVNHSKSSTSAPRAGGCTHLILAHKNTPSASKRILLCGKLSHANN